MRNSLNDPPKRSNTTLNESITVNEIAKTFQDTYSEIRT